jgi:hypothetical protein
MFFVEDVFSVDGWRQMDVFLRSRLDFSTISLLFPIISLLWSENSQRPLGVDCHGLHKRWERVFHNTSVATLFLILEKIRS